MKLKHLVPIAALAAGVSSQTLALTAADTAISNTATLNYSVNGASQTAIVSPVVTFQVDELVTFNITRDTAGPTPTTDAVVNTKQLVKYTITNTGNSQVSYKLAVADDASASTNGTTGDNTNNGAAVNPSTEPNYKIFIDANTDDAAAPAEEFGAGNFPRVPGDVGVSPANSVVILVEVEPTVGVDQNIFAHTLTVTATTDNTQVDIVPVADSAAWVPGTSQIVVDTAAGGITRTEIGAVKITAPDLAIAKTVTVDDDQIGSTTVEKAVPGAVIEYRITVTNSGSEAAGGIVITDAVNSNLTIDASSLEFEIGNGTSVGSTLATAPNASVAGQNVTFTQNNTAPTPNGFTIPAKSGSDDGVGVFVFKATIQ